MATVKQTVFYLNRSHGPHPHNNDDAVIPSLHVGTGRNVSTADVAPSDLNDVTLWLMVYVLPVIFSFGIFGNCVSFAVFLSEKMRRVSTNVYLAALSASNAVFLVAVAVSWTDLVGLKLMHRPGLCQATVYLTYCSGFLSVWLVVCITVENFVINFFLRKASRLCTVRRALSVVVLLTVSAFLLYDFALWTTGVVRVVASPGVDSGFSSDVEDSLCGDTHADINIHSDVNHIHSDVNDIHNIPSDNNIHRDTLNDNIQSDINIDRETHSDIHNIHSDNRDTNTGVNTIIINDTTTTSPSTTTATTSRVGARQQYYCTTYAQFQPVVRFFTLLDVGLTLVVPSVVIVALVVPTCLKTLCRPARAPHPSSSSSTTSAHPGDGGGGCGNGGGGCGNGGCGGGGGRRRGGGSGCGNCGGGRRRGGGGGSGCGNGGCGGGGGRRGEGAGAPGSVLLLSRKERALVRVTRLLCVIIVSFVVLTAPDHLNKLRRVFQGSGRQQGDGGSRDVLVAFIVQVFYHLSFSVNFLYFLVWGKNFRHRFCCLFLALAAVLGRCRRKLGRGR